MILFLLFFLASFTRFMYAYHVHFNPRATLSTLLVILYTLGPIVCKYCSEIPIIKKKMKYSITPTVFCFFLNLY